MEKWDRLIPPPIKRKLLAYGYVRMAPLGALLTLQGLEVVAYREATV